MNIELDTDSMTKLRETLLAEEEVRVMISMRAYEIYVNRGAAPGKEADDWFQAESEILPILINEELNKINGGHIPHKPKASKAAKKAKAVAAAPETAAGRPEIEPLSADNLTNGHGNRPAKAKNAAAKKKVGSKGKPQSEVEESALVAAKVEDTPIAVEKEAKVRAKASKGAAKEIRAAEKELKTAAKQTKASANPKPAKPAKAKAVWAGVPPKSRKTAS